MQEYSFFYTDTNFPNEKFEKVIRATSENEARLQFEKFLDFLIKAKRIVYETK
jgi:hypothetical protein